MKNENKLSGLVVKKGTAVAAPAAAKRGLATKKNRVTPAKIRVLTAIAPDLLKRVDNRSIEMGLSRAAFISMALSRALESQA